MHARAKESIVVRLLLLTLTLFLLSAPSLAQTISGQASVIDGDTIDIHGQRVRLHGIDAPESSQTCDSTARGTWRCGQEAALALDDFIAGRPVMCLGRSQDRYGRTIARCTVGAIDLNGWLVLNGWATAYRTYSKDYVAAEEQAKAGRRNIWSGGFAQPETYRMAQRPAPQAAPSAGCVHKGNISSSGARILHSPGQQHYDRTRVDTDAGERWFCSQDEAVAAGWRQARQ